MALIAASDGKFTLREGKHAVMMAQKIASLRWVPYFGAVVKANGVRTLIASVVLPVGNDVEARKITETARLTSDAAGGCSLSFAKGGKKFAYRFGNGGDGLKLETP